MTDVIELVRLYAEGLMGLTHAEYVGLVRQCCPSSPAVESAINRAAKDPETRINNVIRGRVFREIHKQETGEFSEFDASGLRL